MANYRRLISYIYAYEGGVKGKNIGFAKLESRSGQCKLSINVKKVYVGSSDLGVYLLSPGREILLGNIFVRGGSGEFRTVVSVENVMDSGCEMDRCYGLTIHEKEDAWRAYTTIWEDAVAQAAEITLEPVNSENLGGSSLQIHTSAEELDRERKEWERQETKAAELLKEEPREPEQGAEEMAHAPEPLPGEESQAPEEVLQTRETAKEKKAEGETVEKESSEKGAREPEQAEEQKQPEEQKRAEEQKQPEPVKQNENTGIRYRSISQFSRPSFVQSGAGRLPVRRVPSPQLSPAGSMTPQQASPEGSHQEEEGDVAVPIPLGDPGELERLDREERLQTRPRPLWDSLRSRYPKIQAFDSENTSEILTIKPQDIGLLPRENWNYGNNSFLLHGYYNYRYLILARISDEEKGRVRYILGVPGHYYSNEKYMASMFGFTHFVLARKQTAQDDRFGYWYADIRMELQEQ